MHTRCRIFISKSTRKRFGGRVPSGPGGQLKLATRTPSREKGEGERKVDRGMARKEGRKGKGTGGGKGKGWREREKGSVPVKFQLRIHHCAKSII